MPGQIANSMFWDALKPWDGKIAAGSLIRKVQQDVANTNILPGRLMRVLSVLNQQIWHPQKKQGNKDQSSNTIHEWYEFEPLWIFCFSCHIANTLKPMDAAKQTEFLCYALVRYQQQELTSKLLTSSDSLHHHLSYVSYPHRGPGFV